MAINSFVFPKLPPVILAYEIRENNKIDKDKIILWQKFWHVTGNVVFAPRLTEC